MACEKYVTIQSSDIELGRAGLSIEVELRRENVSESFHMEHVNKPANNKAYANKHASAMLIKCDLQELTVSLGKLFLS